MTKSILPIVITIAIAAGGFALWKRRAVAEDDSDPLSRFEKIRAKVAPRLEKELAAKGLLFGSPVFVRVFKEEKLLELWVEKVPGGQYQLFKSYPICTFSGTLGPKLKEGDRQAPEGFYFVTRKRMNPRSQFHLSFDVGYPNAYDRHHGRTGSFLMVHGNCVSLGCYAMTDKLIEEIYTIADAALAGGQRFFRVHCFPFRMTKERMAGVAAEAQWAGFWTNLKIGHDWFEREKRPPNAMVDDGNYRFSGD